MQEIRKLAWKPTSWVKTNSWVYTDLQYKRL